MVNVGRSGRRAPAARASGVAGRRAGSRASGVGLRRSGGLVLSPARRSARARRPSCSTGGPPSAAGWEAGGQAAVGVPGQGAGRGDGGLRRAGGGGPAVPGAGVGGGRRPGRAVPLPEGGRDAAGDTACGDGAARAVRGHGRGHRGRPPAAGGADGGAGHGGAGHGGRAVGQAAWWRRRGCPSTPGRARAMSGAPPASAGAGSWEMRRERMSPHYTTRWDELATVRG